MTITPHPSEFMRMVYCLCCGRTGATRGEEPIPRTWRWCQLGSQAGPICEPCSSRAHRREVSDISPMGIQPRDIDPLFPALEPKIPRMKVGPLPVALPAKIQKNTADFPRLQNYAKSSFYPGSSSTAPSLTNQRLSESRRSLPYYRTSFQHTRFHDLFTWMVLIASLIGVMVFLLWKI